MMPALLTLAVSRVDETERGAVVGTTSLFLDLSFGLSPAVLGAVAGVAGYDGAFLVSAAVAGCGAALLAARRHALARTGPSRSGYARRVTIERVFVAGAGPHGPRHRPGPRGGRQAGRRSTSRISPVRPRAAIGSPATSSGRSPRAS